MAFAWSFSKVKNFDTCPKRYNEVDVLKNYKERESDQLKWGNYVHDTFKATLQGRVPLPEDLKVYQKWIDRVRARPGKLLVEQKWAITKDFRPCDWRDWDNAWCRMIGDAVNLDTYIACVTDWKTGKSNNTDDAQLLLMAQAMFSTYPTLMRVVCEFVYIKDDCTTPRVYSRQDMATEWPDMLDRVRKLENAHTTQSFPPTPNHFCKRYCPVTSCPHHGK